MNPIIPISCRSDAQYWSEDTELSLYMQNCTKKNKMHIIPGYYNEEACWSSFILEEDKDLCSTIWATGDQTFAVPSMEYLLWRYRYFCFVKLTFEMLIVHRQHSFSTHEPMFLRKGWSFQDKKCLGPGVTWTPDLWIHVECFTLWATGASLWLSHVLEYIVLALAI